MVKIVTHNMLLTSSSPPYSKYILIYIFTYIIIF
nr:MAG TPA: hypothetical protein [Caudoviricetes sp.]